MDIKIKKIKLEFHKHDLLFGIKKQNGRVYCNQKELFIYLIPFFPIVIIYYPIIHPKCYYCGKRLFKWQRIKEHVFHNHKAHEKCYLKRITKGQCCNTCKHGKDGTIYIFCTAPQRSHIYPRCHGGLPQSQNYCCSFYAQGDQVMDPLE